VTALDDLARDYRVAFLHYLPRHEEAALARGYELGRSAVTQGLSILELARVHHEVFLEVLRETTPEDLSDVATAASEFFLEVLATFDMAQRGFLDGRVPRPDPPGPRPGSRGRTRTDAGPTPTPQIRAATWTAREAGTPPRTRTLPTVTSTSPSRPGCAPTGAATPVTSGSVRTCCCATSRLSRP
jgi:hypothetical protein